MEYCGDGVPDLPIVLTEQQLHALTHQDTRLVPEARARKLEADIKKNWDLFYKRNGDRFFKDRHWTIREFQELCNISQDKDAQTASVLLEIGCGTGNLIYPLLEITPGLRVLACDISHEAVALLQKHHLYEELNLQGRLRGLVADVTTEQLNSQVENGTCDLVTLVFVLSAVPPVKHSEAVRRLAMTLKPGGVVLFRDYARYDMAQLRFKPGSKISHNLYVRQDGTTAYFFELQELKLLFEALGFETLDIRYIHRKTVNVKESIDVPRVFLQAKFQITRELPANIENQPG